tara:strand:- start:7811 stop:8518 length:708 start_codon:yes stop_codon:yes gene_type:complete
MGDIMTCKINADTSSGLQLESDTSGSIDIQSGGNTDISFSANALNIKSGTTLTIDSGATITNSGTANGFLGKVKQIVNASDNTLYSISITNSTSDHAGSIAYSITPSSTDHKIKIDFFIPQIRHANGTAGLRMRLYRQINGGGYSHVTGLSGVASSNRLASLAGNYDRNGDGNRSTVALGGTVVDSPSTTSQVDYKFYFGSGDGATTIFVNRTENDADFNYTSRTRTHVCLTEIE